MSPIPAIMSTSAAGRRPGIGAFREIYQEGVVLPVVKLLSRGKVVADILKMLLANVRAKKEVAGDLRAQIAANDIGIRRLDASDQALRRRDAAILY